MGRVRRKTVFPCGHKGTGKICGRCREAERLLERAKSEEPSGVLPLQMEAVRLRASNGVLPAHFEELGYDTDTSYFLASQLGYRRPHLGEPLHSFTYTGFCEACNEMGCLVAHRIRRDSMK